MRDTLGECSTFGYVTTLADDRNGRDDGPRLLFSFWVRALMLKLLRWIPSVNDVTSLTSLEVLVIWTTTLFYSICQVWCL